MYLRVFKNASVSLVSDSLKLINNSHGGIIRIKIITHRMVSGVYKDYEVWPNPVVWKNREGEIKISPGVTKGTFYFPQEWLSRIGEEKFPQERRSRDWGNENFPRSGEAATGEIFLHHDC